MYICANTGDDWHVVLRGDEENYINAVFVNVCFDQYLFICEFYIHITTVGLQAAESIHHSSESHGVHCQRFLEDGP